MLEPRGELDLALKALHAERLEQLRSRHLDDDGALECGFFRHEDAGHPSTAKLPVYAVRRAKPILESVPEFIALRLPVRLPSMRGKSERRLDPGKSRIRVRIRAQQPLERRLKLGIGAPDLRDPDSAICVARLHQLVKGGTNSFPANLVHHMTSDQGSPLISSASQARAERSSRLTVASETFKAVAVSSSERPPKYRCSSIWL